MLKEFLRISRFISNHPLARKKKLLAYKRFIGWQLSQKMVRHPVLYPFVENSVLLIEKGMDPSRMVVIDSRTGCAGHGFMAVAAANAIERGADLAGAADAAHAMRKDVQLLVMVDTLEYLRRGGRIGAASAWIGATLRVKPILTIEGEMQPVERVRTAGRAFERLVAHLETRKQDGCDAFAVQHIQAPDVAERLVERGREIYGRDPDLLSEVGPVIGTHIGPGMLGVAGLRTELLGPM